METVITALKWITEKGGTLEDKHTPTDREDHVWVRCAFDHLWRGRYDNLAKHHWCPHCAGVAPDTIEAMRALAESRGGQCLSTEYKNGKTNLEWVCAFNHKWPATPNNVKNCGSWCKDCRKINVGEELVRATLEEAFPDELFNSTRSVPWMNKLELDGYNEERKLAFEFQGKQHYERVPHFQRKEGAFEAQLDRDARTRAQCAANGVKLLEVPYTIGIKNIRMHVRQMLIEAEYKIAPIEIDDAEFYNRVRARNSTNEKQFARALAVITRKGGTCVSTQYIGYRAPLSIICGEGHPFEASLEAIDQAPHRGPRFCPECGGTRRKSPEELREIVESCGYHFVSVEDRIAGPSERSRRFVTIACPIGHVKVSEWGNFSPVEGEDNPKKGCMKCYRARQGDRTRNNISGWVAKYGFTQLNVYKSGVTPYRWVCPGGHNITATFNSLRGKAKKGLPCTRCELYVFAARNRLTILTDMSEDNIDHHTKIQWRCQVCTNEFPASKQVYTRKNIVCDRCSRPTIRVAVLT